MLDLIFCVLMIIIIVKANKGVVNDTLCNVALVFGILAGIFGLVQALSIYGDNDFWILNIIVMLIAFFLKRAAQHLANLHHQKEEAFQEEYRKEVERRSRFRDADSKYVNTDFDDPNVRFSGGSGGDTWNKK